MSFDLAVDYNTGDLIPAPNNDLGWRTGPESIEQRIRIRLKIKRGSWLIDPTNGTLGSELHSAMRLPQGRAALEAEAAIRQALEPMKDIDVVEIIITPSKETAKAIVVDIEYRSLVSDSGAPLDGTQTATLTIPTV